MDIVSRRIDKVRDLRLYRSEGCSSEGSSGRARCRDCTVNGDAAVAVVVVVIVAVIITVVDIVVVVVIIVVIAAVTVVNVVASYSESGGDRRVK